MSTIKVALVVVAKWEDYYLDEWLDYNHKLGFDKIIMYQNNWRTDIERPFLEKRIGDGNAVQLKLFNKFLATNTEYDWIAFVDCDEFIVLNQHNNIKELIEQYKDKTNSLSLNWYFYGSGGLETRTSNSLLKMFTKRNAAPDQHIKVLVNARCGTKMNLPHNADIASMDTRGHYFTGPFNAGGPTDVAVINHYHNKTKEDWELRCKRGRVDCDLQHDPNRWNDEINDNIEVEDLTALNFLYSPILSGKNCAS
jgi:hypothetical protein